MAEMFIACFPLVPSVLSQGHVEMWLAVPRRLHAKCPTICMRAMQKEEFCR